MPLKMGISCTNFYATIKQELQSGDTKIRWTEKVKGNASFDMKRPGMWSGLDFEGLVSMRARRTSTRDKGNPVNERTGLAIISGGCVNIDGKITTKRLIKSIRNKYWIISFNIIFT